jgi:hypothetical protein
VVSVVLEACPRLRCAGTGSDDIADQLPFRSCLDTKCADRAFLALPVCRLLRGVSEA